MPLPRKQSKIEVPRCQPQSFGPALNVKDHLDAGINKHMRMGCGHSCRSHPHHRGHHTEPDNRHLPHSRAIPRRMRWQAKSQAFCHGGKPHRPPAKTMDGTDTSGVAVCLRASRFCRQLNTSKILPVHQAYGLRWFRFLSQGALKILNAFVKNISGTPETTGIAQNACAYLLRKLILRPLRLCDHTSGIIVSVGKDLLLKPSGQSRVAPHMRLQIGYGRRSGV